MNAGPKTACGGKRPSTGVVAQPRARDPRAIFRAAENESFSPEKHVISEYTRVYADGVSPQRGGRVAAVKLVLRW